MSTQVEGLIQVVTYCEENPKTGMMEEVISHGVNLYTFKIFTMEQVSVAKVRLINKMILQT